ncbi:hypothetical protein NDU88_006340 [Pleurodeles waltl]|uniref:Uncharacterized protein n=1 Tax=Pleurodeles waltl TaxID=8319 RepID=A0AAV7TXE7_PLEWA|nr:hypothetical protein NDU88_006340 [Pleurodeles waltl]
MPCKEYAFQAHHDFQASSGYRYDLFPKPEMAAISARSMLFCLAVTGDLKRIDVYVHARVMCVLACVLCSGERILNPDFRSSKNIRGSLVTISPLGAALLRRYSVRTAPWRMVFTCVRFSSTSMSQSPNWDRLLERAVLPRSEGAYRIAVPSSSSKMRCTTCEEQDETKTLRPDD